MLAVHWKDDGSDQHRLPQGTPWLHGPDCLAHPSLPSYGAFGHLAALQTPRAFARSSSSWALQFLHLTSPVVFPKFICGILSVPLSCICLHKVGSWAVQTNRRVCLVLQKKGTIRGDVQPEKARI